jgi:uncharacterized protein YjbI with pentapeptide repeats
MDQEHRWRLTKQQVLWGIAIAVVLVILVCVGYLYGVTLWDWLELLIVPAALTGSAIWFNWAQRQRELTLEERRANASRSIEERRSQDAALRSYLDQMSQLLIEQNLRSSQPDDEVRTLARARTLTVLWGLGPDHKRDLLQFLYEAGLINKGRPIITLDGANLMHGNLKGANLLGADLSGSHLLGADLSSASLIRTDLSGAYLRNASLDGTFLIGADLSGADLSDADLSDADLSDANVSEEQLSSCLSLRGAKMPDRSKHD